MISAHIILQNLPFCKLGLLLHHHLVVILQKGLKNELGKKCLCNRRGDTCLCFHKYLLNLFESVPNVLFPSHDGLLLCLVVVQLLSHVWLFVTHGLQHARLPCPSPSPRVCPNSSPLGWWCDPTVSSTAIPFSSCLQSFPDSGCFPMSWLFA